MHLSSDLLDKLACPKCHGLLKVMEDRNGLACQVCDLVYEVVDDIPNFIVAEAKPLGIK